MYSLYCYSPNNIIVRINIIPNREPNETPGDFLHGHDASRIYTHCYIISIARAECIIDTLVLNLFAGYRVFVKKNNIETNGRMRRDF